MVPPGAYLAFIHPTGESNYRATIQEGPYSGKQLWGSLPSGQIPEVGFAYIVVGSHLFPKETLPQDKTLNDLF